MPAAMTLTVSTLSGYGKVRRQDVSVPLVTTLLEPPSRYRLPAEPATNPANWRISARGKRGPSLKTLVKLAMKADTAEALGLALRRRFEQRQRGGEDVGGDLDRELAELEARLFAEK